ncbi:ASCH domain-containing protein [Cryobacterium sp. BB307]|uniref:ASCH domain-containing protein n=1 Tax=Cryobacterium sp. BB307 TaxID=2716317 RepID=UPI0014452504|nr:ASCH domain-containing protein [Cryobacterium sp. BB307]
MTDTRTPAAEPDLAAAAAMWALYAHAHPDAIRGEDYTVDRFGDSAELADLLLRQVTHGPKRATSTLVADFAAEGEESPRIGSHWVACDGAGAPRAILRTLELRIGDFGSADELFAFDEGEDDRSLESWRAEHRRYWQRTSAARGATWSEADEIVFERFAVVWPPELAD